MTSDQPRHYVKSSRSGGSGGNCVECAYTSAGVHLRDSKQPAGGKLVISHAGWSSFLAAVRASRFDHG